VNGNCSSPSSAIGQRPRGRRQRQPEGHWAAVAGDAAGAGAIFGLSVGSQLSSGMRLHARGILARVAINRRSASALSKGCGLEAAGFCLLLALTITFLCSTRALPVGPRLRFGCNPPPNNFGYRLGLGRRHAFFRLPGRFGKMPIGL
jgi:hypothetical protein